MQESCLHRRKTSLPYPLFTPFQHPNLRGIHALKQCNEVGVERDSISLQIQVNHKHSSISWKLYNLQSFGSPAELGQVMDSLKYAITYTGRQGYLATELLSRIDESAGYRRKRRATWIIVTT